MNVTKTEKIAEGKWHVRHNGSTVPGMILGGNRRYVIQVAGQSIGIEETLTAASRFLVDYKLEKIQKRTRNPY